MFAKDLLTEDFPVDGTVKLVAQSKTSDGLTMKTTIQRFLLKDQKGNKEFFDALVEPNFEWKNQNVEFTGKISSSNQYSAALSIINPLSVATKLDITASQTEREGATAKLAATYQRNPFVAKVTVSHPLPFSPKTSDNLIKVDADLLVQFPQSFYFGAIFKVMRDITKGKTFAQPSCRFGYTQEFWDFYASGTSILSDDPQWGASFYQRLSSNLRWGLDFELDRTWTRGPVCSVGGEYTLDPSTTVKGKWLVKWTPTSRQTEMRLGLAAKEKINPVLSATFGADLNVRNLLGETIGDPHSFGLELKFQE